MKRFWILMAIVIVTTLGLWVLTRIQTPGGAKGRRAEVAGMPVACMAESSDDETPFFLGKPCWISLGGTGVLVLGAGVGIVELGVFGVGLLFACGQIAGGLIAMGQAGVGLIFWAGQAGIGLTGVGQGMLGWLTAYQGGEKRDGKRFLQELDHDAKDLFSFFGERPG